MQRFAATPPGAPGNLENEMEVSIEFMEQVKGLIRNAEKATRGVYDAMEDGNQVAHPHLGGVLGDLVAAEELLASAISAEYSAE